MVGALLLIWIAFDLLSGGLFLTPRNLWNLSVQSSSVAIMATGMVLVIVTRNIDLSIGSMLGFIGMVMGVIQADLLPMLFGFDSPATWIITLVGGLVLGVVLGAFQGFLIAYLGIPAFIVTLGGLLVWIGKRVFIGSDSALVAPVRIGDGAYVAAGSIITENVPPNALAIARGRQVIKLGWATTRRREQAAEAAAGAKRPRKKSASRSKSAKRRKFSSKKSSRPSSRKSPRKSSRR